MEYLRLCHRRVETYCGVSSSLVPGWLGDVRHNSAIPSETMAVLLLGLRDPAVGSSGWGVSSKRITSSSGETVSPPETNRGMSLVSASIWGPEDSGLPCSSSSTILTSAVSSSSSYSWQALSSSTWWSSSSTIQQSLMRFLNFVMEVSTTLSEVCRASNLCSISL